jgi:hypothetical protein
MNVIGNRCTAQTNFHKLHRRGRTLFAHTHLTAMRAHTVRPYGITDADELPNPFTQMKPSR